MLCCSPWVDLTDEETSDSWERNVRYDYLPADLANLFASMYKGDASWDDVCPTRSPRDDLALLPPLLFEVGECEVLHDQVKEPLLLSHSPHHKLPDFLLSLLFRSSSLRRNVSTPTWSST